MNLAKSSAGSLIIVLSLCLTGSAWRVPTRPFDEFGDIKCEDEMARLDNFAVQLQNESTARGLIIFYGGRRFRGRLPKRGEAAARAARLKLYLVQRRNIPLDQVIVMDGGFQEEFHVVLWIVPQGANLPSPPETIPANQIKFRKGKARARDFRCRV